MAHPAEFGNSGLGSGFLVFFIFFFLIYNTEPETSINRNEKACGRGWGVLLLIGGGLSDAGRPRYSFVDSWPTVWDNHGSNGGIMYVYWKLKPDGADFKCSQCGERGPAGKMIVLENTELKPGEPGFRQVCHNDGWCAEISGLECKGEL